MRASLQEMVNLNLRLHELESVLEKEVTECLHEFTAQEWIQTNLSPKISELDRIISQACAILNNDH